MVALDGVTPEGDPAPGEDRESSMDRLAVPTKKTKKKSPTPVSSAVATTGASRDRSATPVRGRSQTPFSAYMNRRSMTPSGVPSQWRSITPFLKREEKEKTPFELGHDLKAQLISNKMVFDKALVMDITEPEEPAARYITSDISVIDRAAVMDVSNVEVIYLIEEYEEAEPEPVEEVVVTKKKKKAQRRPRAASTDSKVSESPAREDSIDMDEESLSHEKSPSVEKKKGGKKKVVKKEKKEKSPSPKLTLKLDLGPPPGSKASKKLFDQPPPAPDKKPPAKAPGKSKLVLQMEEQARKAAEEAAKEAAKATKPKSETFEEKQKRLKAEAEEKARQEEEERRRIEEEEALAAEEEEVEPEEDENYDNEENADEDQDQYDQYRDDGEQEEELQEEEAEEESKKKEPSVESFLRPNPEEEKLWQRIAEEEGIEFAEKIRKFTQEQREFLSEKERDATWQMRRERARQPKFINYLTDRAAEEGQNVRLVCAVAGPDLSVKWYKDGKQLEPGPRYRIINNNNILSLTIINPTILDSGEYKCTIINPNDEAVSTAIVTIYQVFKDEPSPPMFSLIRDYFHLHDDELTIECHCHGVPRPRIIWLKGQLVITPSYKFTLLEEAHGVYKLLIYRPSDKDSGLYICRAVNESGEAEIQHNVEFVKNRHWHGRGVHLAHDLISQAMQAEAAKAMEEAMKSKAESDRKYVSAYSRSTDEPLVSPKQKLKIATHLRDRIAILGSTVKLFCNIVGPDPRIQWLKDDSPIQWSSKVRNLSSEGKAVLELKEIESTGTGVYKCIAKNDHSEVNTSCYLKVHSAQVEGDESEPMFALPIKDVYHSSENDLIISTKVRGNPRPKITWLIDEIPINVDLRIQQIEHLDGICELIINKPIQLEDAGVYTCIASNKLGETKTTHTVAVDNLPTSRRSSIALSMSAEESRSRRGSTVGAADTSGTPKPEKKKKEKKTAEATGGEYERRHVAVPEPSLKEKLYLVANLHNRYVPEGKRCKLQAMIEGPDPQIRWLKNGQNVVYGPKIRNMSSMGMAVLEFTSPTEEDSGEYTLIARNQANEIQTSAMLQVYQPKVNTNTEPVFTRALKDTYFLLRHELILETHCRGDPTPEIAWYKDNLQISASDRIEIVTHSDGTCELTIDKPNKNDSGKYSCRAENNLGKSEVNHYVLFETEDSIVAGNIHGVFHADKNLMKKQQPREISEPVVEKEMKGKKGKKHSIKDSTPSSVKDETPAPVVATTAEPEKPTKREKKIGIHFPTKLMNRVVAEGSKLKLSCFVQSPDPVVKWFRDEQPIAYGPKSKLGFMQGLCTLEIPSATVADSGIYKVVAKDTSGETSTSCKVEVYADPGSGDVAPTFTRGIKDSFVAKTNELILSCHVRGLPTPTITWVKDGVKLEANARYQLTEHSDGTCELFIADPIPMDSGKYICKAENRVEEVEISHQVHIEPHMVRPISPTRLSEEKEPTGSREPTKEPSVAKDGSRRESSTKSVSRRESAAAGGEGGEGEKKDKKKKKQADTEYAGRRSPPPPPDPKKNLHFANSLINRTVPEGSKVRMSVAIFGPDPQCRWYRVGPEGEIPIAFGPKSKMSCQDNLAVLVLDQLTEDDSGEYKLVARGTENTVQTSCKIIVFPKAKKDQSIAPVFTVGIKDNYSLQDDELVLDCRVRGVPRPKIRWIRDSVPIIPDDKKFVQFDQADGLCRLIVKNPTAKDSGNYVCEAENDAQAEKTSHHVEFAGKEKYIQEKTAGFYHRDPNKPHFAAPLGTQIVTIGGTIAITAEFGETAQPTDVQWFKDKQPIKPSSNVKSFVVDNAYILAIEGAGHDWDGQYTCRASNSYGRVESHANVTISSDVGKSKQVQFLSKPEPDMKILIGDPFSISFRVQGDPKPKLTFYKGAKDITRSERVTKEAHDDYIRFTVHNSTAKDSGTYFVVARNELSSDRIFTTVTVKDRTRSVTPTASRWGKPIESYPETTFFKNPPEPISSQPLVVDAGKHHISLQWGKPMPGDYAPVVAYRVDVWQLGSDGGAQWRELGVTPINSYDAFNLKPGAEYHFRVTPRNRYGWGPSVQTSTPITIGGAECLPEFVKILSGQLKALKGQECVLDCVVKGTPRPRIVWYKDGQPIMSSDRVLIKQIGFTCRLRISEVNDTDSGRYTCEASNNIGRVSTFARLQVVSDPKIYAADTKLKKYVEMEDEMASEMIPMFTMRLRDRRVQVTYPVRLTCQVVGYPNPTVTWYKDGEEIQNDGRFMSCDDGQFNTLEISKTCLDDIGTYTATAKNALGSVSCSCSLIVDKGIRAYIAPDFYMPLDPIYTFKEGEEIRLTAKVEAYPSVGVSWHRNGTRLRPSRKTLATLNHDGFVELVIADASASDAGVYVCCASNPVGKIESTCRVIIEEATEQEQHIRKPLIQKDSEQPYSKEPMFIKKPRSSEAYEGDTVILSCEVVGDPTPDVVWLRDFMKPEYYKDAPQFHPVGDGPEYRLEIPSAKLDFTGTYSVIATNCHGQAKAIISLQIYAKDISKSMDKGSVKHGNVETIPTFERRLQDMRCCDGDAITLESYVVGVPEPIIIWEKDGRVLPSTCKDFEMGYDGKKATLSISRVYPEDEGEYTCIAKNNIGRSFSSACVLVDVPEEKENLLSKQLHRPTGFLSTTSTPRSTPRATPVRNVSPLRLSYRATSIDLSTERRRFAAPKFYAIPNGRVVEEGDTVEFQCAIAGHPMPWSTWDKDGVIVSQTTRIRMRERDDLRFLEIEDVTFDDAGLYRVTLENDFGRVEATARLDVIAKPRSFRSRSTRSVRSSSRSSGFHMSRRIMGPSTRIGGRLALASAFRGSSVPSTKYYHNGVEINENERIHFEISDNHIFSMIVDNVDKSDDGIYMCIAQNQEGIISTTTSVVIYPTESVVIPEDEPVILSPLPEIIKTMEGKETDLSFEIKCFEPYSYTWYHNDNIVLDCDDLRYIDHGNGIITLRIMNTLDLDGGYYKCTIMTKNGSCSTHCDLIVKKDHLDEHCDYELDITKNPQPILSYPGSIVSFCAKVYPPHALGFWSVCGRKVESDSHEFFLESQSNGVKILHILGVDYYHSGEIKFTTIHPINSSITLTAYTRLTILPAKISYENIYKFDNLTDCNEAPSIPVYITKEPDDCTALVGGTIVLKVQFNGRPIPKVSWFKAGRLIRECENINIRTTKSESTIRITDITTDDSGKYTVEVMNSQSCDFAAVSVAVEGPPEPPSQPSTSTTHDRISIAWCGPPYDGGCMITAFIIEMQENDSPWHEIAKVVDSLAYTIKDIKSNTIYKFRIRAENIHGLSEPSKPSDEVIIKIPEILNGYDDEVKMHKKLQLIRQGGEFKERFEIQEELGKGRFGVVYKVIEKETHQTLAAKIIKCIKVKDREKVQDEITIMKSLEHPKLLQLAAAFETNREIIMIMEYITGGELFERVVADDFTLTERDCILFLRQICEGVAYMHSQSIVHLDLKPENIMCHTRTSHQIKIIDFGLAQRLNTEVPVRVLFGTPEFIAPEIINYEPINFLTDMWSVGVICYVLLSGLSPFMGDSDVDTFANITRADYDFDDDAFDTISQEAKDFILNLLVHRKEDRLTAIECLESKWLSQYHDENLINKRICTDKLKKFIIRRKWQKTGNAIRALGRMANLSASRRNSAISTNTSLSSSPRPSISAGSGYTNLLLSPATVIHMTSVNEEDDDDERDSNLTRELEEKQQLVTQKLTANNERIVQRTEIRNKTECSERSDSGFSECSSCSGGAFSGNITCVCPHPLVEKPQATIEEENISEKPNELSIAVPHDILKTKLEKIAIEHQEMMKNELHIEEFDSIPQKYVLEKHRGEFIENYQETGAPILYSDNEEKILISIESDYSESKPIIVKNRDESLEKSMETIISKEKIRKSDFTNTISMRKKSLENNLCREKSKIKVSKPLFEQHGKVSMLKDKFNQHNEAISGKISSSQCTSRSQPFANSSKLFNSNSSSHIVVSKSKNVFDRLAYNPKTNANQTTASSTQISRFNGQSMSLPGSPLPQIRSSANIRLSNRVREVTERLSMPKTTVINNTSPINSPTTIAPGRLSTFCKHNSVDLKQQQSTTMKTSSTTILLKNNSINYNHNTVKYKNKQNNNLENNKFSSDTKEQETDLEQKNIRNYNTRS